ncbi:MAG: hypothetical protein QGH59_03475, partial [Gemmatimonadota bacterium]|nr:hypothetical protein [Gemmatimonadota bacterium]
TNFTGSLTASEIEGQFDLTDGASTYSRNAAQAAELTYEGATDTFPNNVAPDAVNDSIAVEIGRAQITLRGVRRRQPGQSKPQGDDTRAQNPGRGNSTHGYLRKRSGEWRRKPQSAASRQTA